MSEPYRTQPCDIVHNNEISFKLLCCGDNCQFMNFYESVCKDKQLKKDMISIIAMMDLYRKDQMLPQKKFKYIHIHKCKNVYEFKKNSLRVYILLKDDVCIILGGFKKDQDNDIERIKKILKNFNND